MHNLEIYTVDSTKFEDPLKGEEICCSFADNVFSIYNDDTQIFINARTQPNYKITARLTLPKSSFYLMAPLDMEQKIFVCNGAKVMCYSLSLEMLFEMELDEEVIAGKWNSTNDLFAVMHISGKVALYSMDSTLGQMYLVASCTDANPMENSNYTSRKGDTKKVKPKIVIFKCLDLKPCIDWKENSELFCINVPKDNGDRAIHVYNQQCEFLYKSEGIIAGLESKIAFKPVGNMIACVTSKTGFDQTVAFIEKNGELRFELPMETKGKILDLQWSPCSLCLAIHQKNEIKEWVDLYLSLNFKFHLKQRLIIPHNNLLRNICFKKVIPNMFSLQLFLGDGLCTYKYVRKFSHSSNFAEDKGATSIISGNKLITYFYKNGITAPDNDNGHFIIDHKYPINAVIYAQHEYKFAIVDCMNNVHVYDYSDVNNCDRILLFNVGVGTLNIPLSYYRFYFDMENYFVGIGLEDSVINDFAYKFHLIEDMVIRSEKMEVPKYNIFAAYDSANALVPTVLTANTFPIPIFYAYIVKIKKTIYTFQFDAMGTVYINNSPLRGLYTSLYCNGKFLIATKSRPEESEMPIDKLVCVELKKMNIDKIIAEKALESCAYQRSIEQGGVIINSIDNSPVVILHMPRGNLETIEVRSIAILTIKEYLSQNKFKEALQCILTYSLRLDLIFDLDPERFLKEKEAFFKLLESTGNLAKFLTELRDDNSLTKEDFPYITIPNIMNRKKSIASAFETVFMTFSKPQNNLPILTLATYINTKSVEETISKLSQTARTLGALSCFVIQSLKLISRHVENRQLYNAALACFDIKMAEIIARRSQMDPRIYETFHYRIRGMDSVQQRFTILNEIGNYKRAMQYYLYMYRRNKVTDKALLAYAVDKNVIEALYFYCRPSDSILKMVSEVYVKELSLQQRHRDIAIVCNRLGNFAESVDAFLKASMWNEALTVINSNGLAVEERIALTKTVANYLKEGRKFEEAASLFLHTVKDTQAALQCYMDGHLYAEALKVIADEQNMRFEMVVIDSMRYYCLQMTTKVEQMRLDYIKHFERLMEIRNEKLLKDTQIEEPQDDLYSDLQSVFSASTIRSTTRSTTSTRSNRSVARRQKKEERKLLNFKKGSKYEDIALMVELHSISNKIADIFKEIDVLYMSLMIRYFGDKIISPVQTLHVQISDFQRLICDTAGDIWKPEFITYVPKPADKGAYLNIALLDNKYKVKPTPYVPTASFPEYKVDDMYT